jgi:hypothetical protein
MSKNTHLSHCFQDEYDTSCKYGDKDCPADPKNNKMPKVNNIFELIKPPFYYADEGQMIFDANNQMVLDIRMWGMLQKYENAEELQDGFGKMLAEKLTEIAQQENQNGAT